jgi:hypothetical protein
VKSRSCKRACGEWVDVVQPVIIWHGLAAAAVASHLSGEVQQERYNSCSSIIAYKFIRRLLLLLLLQPCS